MKICEEPRFVEIFTRSKDFVSSGLEVIEIKAR